MFQFWNGSREAFKLKMKVILKRHLLFINNPCNFVPLETIQPFKNIHWPTEYNLTNHLSYFDKTLNERKDTHQVCVCHHFGTFIHCECFSWYSGNSECLVYFKETFLMGVRRVNLFPYWSFFYAFNLDIYVFITLIPYSHPILFPSYSMPLTKFIM